MTLHLTSRQENFLKLLWHFAVENGRFPKVYEAVAQFSAFHLQPTKSPNSVTQYTRGLISRGALMRRPSTPRLLFTNAAVLFLRSVGALGTVPAELVGAEHVHFSEMEHARTVAHTGALSVEHNGRAPQRTAAGQPFAAANSAAAMPAAPKSNQHGAEHGAVSKPYVRLIAVPFFGAAVACGSPRMLLEESAESSLSVSAALLPAGSKSAAARGELAAFRASGDSMDSAGIAEGDTVVVQVGAARVGDIVLASIDGAGTLKRLFQKNNVAMLCPQSSNPSHTPLFIHESESSHIVGPVVAVLPSL